MIADEDVRNSDGWLEPAVSSILDTIPGHHTVDVRSVTGLVLLLATQGDVSVQPGEAEAAIIAACLRDKRPVAL